MEKILITRHQNKAKELKEYLENNKNIVICEPLFEVQKIKTKKINQNFGAILITSSNAIETVAENNFEKNIKIFCIGQRTSNEIKKYGFTNIEFPTNENAISLKKLIINNYQNNNLPILYFHGEITSLDFSKELKSYNILVENFLCYKALPKDFSQEFLQNCQKSNFNYILIFSQNSAKIFANLARKHNLINFFNNSKILGFSNKICDILIKSNFTKVAKFDEFKILKNYYNL